MTQTWHAHDDTLRAWADGSAAPVLAASVETHLLRCDTCRARVGALRDADTPVAGTPVTRTSPLLSDADRRWAALADEIDRPRSRPLLRVGLGTPALRAAWLAALAMLLVLPVAVLEAPGSLPLMLALAPVAPLAAVALAYGRGAEPAGEMAFATPSAGLRVVARRALLVSVTAVPLGVVAALAVGLPLELALGWLLPGAALAALVMLSGTIRLQRSRSAGASPSVLQRELGQGWIGRRRPHRVPWAHNGHLGSRLPPAGDPTTDGTSRPRPAATERERRRPAWRSP